MQYTTWTAQLPDGGTSEEFVLTFDRGRVKRLLMLPPLFDEHNKTRRQMVEIMRRLDLAGMDCFLPDLPGCNESRVPLARQTLSGWRQAAMDAARAVSATTLFAIRGGALVMPETLPGYVYTPAKGAQLLRAMIRARTIAAREAGREEKASDLLEKGRSEGLELAGWRLGREFIREFETAEPAMRDDLRLIEQAEIGGSPLWLRAEPDDDPEQADAIAAIIASAELGE